MRFLIIVVFCGVLTLSPRLVDAGGRITIAQTDEAEITFWESVKDSKDADEIKAYLAAYPKGKFVPLAKLRIKKLEKPRKNTVKQNKTKKAKQPANKKSGKSSKTKYQALERFGDIFERVRTDYVVKPDNGKLIRAAVKGTLNKHPSAEAEALADKLFERKCKEESTTDNTYECLDVFGDVLEVHQNSYSGDFDKLVNASIDSMIASLDPHSAYLSAVKLADMRVQNRGAFGGVGIEVTMHEGVVKVVAPIDGSPASIAEIQSGDLITHLDDEPIQGKTLAEAVGKMRGKVGSPLKLTVVREGRENPFDVRVVRDQIKIKPVRWRREGDVGYVRITTFNEQASDATNSAVKDLASNKKLSGLIIDLRNTPGGLLSKVIDVTDAFLERGAIVSTRGRDKGSSQRYQAQSDALIKGKPIVVLVNGGTAAGAEILAGALQDHKRATVIGTRTFGKGTVQTIIPLGASGGALRLTTANYYTPANRSIQAVGITPDIVVNQPLPETLQAKTPQEFGESTLKGHFKNEEGKVATAKSSYVPKNPKDDKQLQFALSHLRGDGANRKETVPVPSQMDYNVEDLERLD